MAAIKKPAKPVKGPKVVYVLMYGNEVYDISEDKPYILRAEKSLCKDADEPVQILEYVRK